MTTTEAEARVIAAEARVAAGRRLSDVDRGGLVAVQRHSRALAPRVAAVLTTDDENAARRARRRREHDDAEHEARDAARRQATWERVREMLQ